ncbi:MAG: hypothetical protein AAB362_00380 [Patescibacteria group bacterium]
MKIARFIGVTIGIVLISSAVDMVYAPEKFIYGILIGGTGLCCIVIFAYRDVIIFRAEHIHGGLTELDPLKVYERLFIRKELSVKEPCLVVFRILNEKKRYKTFTMHAPPRYFKVTDNGDTIPYLWQIKGGKKTLPNLAKIYLFPKNRP